MSSEKYVNFSGGNPEGVHFNTTETSGSMNREWLACGHGASDKPTGHYTPEQFADDLAVVMDAAGWDVAVIGGASMGCCVALALAAAHPARTRGLALIDTTAWYGEDAPAAWEGRRHKAVNNGFGAMTDFQRTRWFSDGWRARNP